MNDEEAFTAQEFIVPSDGIEGFCTPVFYKADNQNPFVPLIEDGKISSFRPIELQVSDSTKDLPRKCSSRVGDGAFWVFLNELNSIISGSTKEIRSGLRLEFKAVLERNPFLALEIAEVLEDPIASRRALQKVTTDPINRIPLKQRASFVSSFATDFVWQKLLCGIGDVERRRDLREKVNLIRVSVESGGEVTARDLSGGRLAESNELQIAAKEATAVLRRAVFDRKYGYGGGEQLDFLASEEKSRLPAPKIANASNDSIIEEIRESARELDNSLFSPIVNVSRSKHQETRLALFILLLLTHPSKGTQIVKIYKDRSNFVTRMISHIDKEFDFIPETKMSDLEMFIAKRVGYFVNSAHYGNRGRLLMELSRILYIYPNINKSIRRRVEKTTAFDILYLKEEILHSLEGKE